MWKFQFKIQQLLLFFINMNTFCKLLLSIGKLAVHLTLQR